MDIFPYTLLTIVLFFSLILGKGPLTSIFIVHVYDRNENLCSLPFMSCFPSVWFRPYTKKHNFTFHLFCLWPRKNILFVTQISIYKLPKMELTTEKNRFCKTESIVWCKRFQNHNYKRKCLAIDQFLIINYVTIY